MTTVKLGKHNIDVSLDVIDIDLIRSKTPVKTGNLRDNFTLDLDGNIINPVEYADEVELGTTTMPGAFMVERSINEIVKRLEDRIVEQANRPGIIKLPEIVLKVRV